MTPKQRLRRMGRRPRRQRDGRYQVPGVWLTVRECDLSAIAQGFEQMEERL